MKFGKNQALGVKERRISGLQWPVTERQMGGVGTEEKWNTIFGIAGSSVSSSMLAATGLDITARHLPLPTVAGPD